MTVVRFLLVVLLAVPSACGNVTTPARTPPDETRRPLVAERPRAALRPFSARRPDAAGPLAVISGQGVGDLLIGKSIPARHLAPAAATRRRYVHRMYTDAQTFEGFRLASPPVTLSLKNGPFHRWFEDPKRKGGMSQKPPTAQLAREALRLARSGHPIASIVVDRPGVKTAAGLGVGSTWADIQRAHPGAKLRPNPPQFGQDRCVATLPPLQRTYAYFKACATAKAGGPITRILIFAL